MITNFSDSKSIAGIATNLSSYNTLNSICQPLNLDIWLPNTLSSNNINNALFYDSSLKENLVDIWHKYNAFVFCLATGAVVRLIADLLENKATDPAILVIDEQGKYVISLAGGHQGGADFLTRLVAEHLGAIPILTGSSNANNLMGIDIMGNSYNWLKGEGNWTEVSAAISRQETVQVIQDCGSILWRNSLPENHNFNFTPPLNKGGLRGDQALSKGGIREDKFENCSQIYITYKKANLAENTPQVYWYPRVLWVGIGCERGSSKTLIDFAIKHIFETQNLAMEAIASIATIDIKADEVGLLEFCQENNYPLLTFDAETLSKIEVPNPSKIVNQEVNTPSVAEAACLAAATNLNKFNIVRETISNPLLVSKQIVKMEGEKGAVTVAVAQSDLEYVKSNGKLSLIGIGPGNLNQITPAAKTAIMEADVIIGYSLYIDLIKPLFYPGQIVESWPITKEKERAQRAIELAQWGLNVGVISSGDCGIYAMGGLVFEELAEQNWDGKQPSVQVFPGISALQSASSRVGAPLMHDFCTVSLSDLLTPWEVIEKRLNAAAMGDFITVFYNPKSKTRTQQIYIARDIFLQYRDGNTPVAIVTSAYRENEQIRVTTLEKMLDFPIDMLTTVIIGNRSTKNYQNWIITPRGYLGFE